jgi:serine/threonine-protein kinase
MTAGGADRWNEIDRLFTAALDRPASEREAYVRGEAGADRELAGAVLDLLRAEQDSAGRFDAPGAQASLAFIHDLTGRPGTLRRIGPFTILRELGRGGMGTVYLGERAGEGFRQQAAIKVLRRGVDTVDVLRRFMTERRILASLSHPNIARLYDGGATDDGRPYLAMEYIDGQPITAYCDRHRLGIRERLAMILEVADAVRAAHAALVVHRDLKPSNILVTADRRVKLLDFGIAKLIADDGAHTRTSSLLLTPDHASPEQLRGDPVTTATDIFQIGVLIFELLTGQPPYRASDLSAAGLRELGESLRIPRPSTVCGSAADASAVAFARGAGPAQLKRQLAGDLDTIAGKALHPDPARRYGSVEELAGDVRRFLEGRPISARPDSTGYRTRLFLRRHPWVAPAAGVALVVGAAYVVTVTRYTSALEEERTTATYQAQRAQEVQRFLVELFGSADPYAPADSAAGRNITVVQALEVGVERLKTSLRNRPAVRASILVAISEVYQDLGVLDRALPLREEALALEEVEFGPASREVRDSLGRLALIRGELGEADASAELHDRRLRLALDAAAPDPAEVADARIRLARSLISRNRAADAERELREVLDTAAAGHVPAREIVEATRALADVERVLARLTDSEATARRAVALADSALGGDSIAGATARGTLAQTLGLLGRVDEADALFRAAVDTLERRLGSDHAHRLATMSNWSVLHLNAGNLREAESLLREIVAIGERVHGPRHPAVAGYLQNHATVLVRLDRLADARTIYERVAALYRETLDESSHVRALPLVSLSGLHLTESRPAAAEAAAREALDILRRALPAGHFITAVAECRVARALVARKQSDDAGEYFARAVDPLMATTNVPEYRRECLSAAADFHTKRGDDEEAARLRAALTRPS